MGTIDNPLFARWGARGCSNSDYNLVQTSCCGGYMVEDGELGELYTQPAQPAAHVPTYDLSTCPLCQAPEWDYKPLAQWPHVPNGWTWARCANPAATDR